MSVMTDARVDAAILAMRPDRRTPAEVIAEATARAAADVQQGIREGAS